MGKPKGSPPTPSSYKPGESGNPGGRKPSIQSFGQMCRENSNEYFAEINRIAHDRTDKQQLKAIELLLAYGHGRPVQTQNVRVVRSLSDLTDEELEALSKSAAEELGK